MSIRLGISAIWGILAKLRRYREICFTLVLLIIAPSRAQTPGQKKLVQGRGRTAPLLVNRLLFSAGAKPLPRSCWIVPEAAPRPGPRPHAPSLLALHLLAHGLH